MDKKWYQHLKYQEYIKYAVIGFVVLIFIIPIVNFIMVKIVHVRKQVAVPDLYNVDLKTAQSLLKDKKLILSVQSGVFDKKVDVGNIVSQIPEHGSIVREQKEIRVSVSKGGEHVEIPDVTNIPQRMAEITLRNNGALIGQEKEIYSRYISKGKIIKQLPEANTVSPKGCMVHLYISKGEPPSHLKLMPMLLNLTEEEAIVILDEENLKYNIEKKLVEDFGQEQLVIEQEPKADVEINENIIVNLVVAEYVGKSPELEKD